MTSSENDRETNQATFTCPIFDSKTKFSDCEKLRDMVWVGKKPTVRRGCQACMSSSKCPVVHIINQNIKNAMDGRPGINPYYSETPKHLKLSDEILVRIRPIIIQDHQIQARTVPNNEIDLMNTANERITAAMKIAPKQESMAKPKRKAKAKTVETTTQSDIHKAATTGDMAAAINKQD